MTAIKKTVRASRLPKQNDRRRFNAVTTGAYTPGLLPWENKNEFRMHCTEFKNYFGPKGKIETSLVMDIALNRWKRHRLRLMATVATLRHGFGQDLEQSGAQSWREALSAIRKRDTRRRETLNSIVVSMAKAWDVAGKSQQTPGDSTLLQEIDDACTKAGELLVNIDAKLDLEREFFEQFPQKLEQETRLESSLDAQFEKMSCRFFMLQEHRMKREEESLRRQQAVAVSQLLAKPTIAETRENASPSNDGGTELEGPDRDNTGQPSADGGDRPWRNPGQEVDLDADDEELDKDDPLRRFIEE